MVLRFGFIATMLTGLMLGGCSGRTPMIHGHPVLVIGRFLPMGCVCNGPSIAIAAAQDHLIRCRESTWRGCRRSARTCSRKCPVGAHQACLVADHPATVLVEHVSCGLGRARLEVIRCTRPVPILEGSVASACRS